MRPITDFASLQSAVDSETVLHVPPGEHRVGPIRTRGRPLTIRGDGTQSRLIFDDPGDFIRFDGGQTGRDAPQLLLEDFAIQTQQSAGAAVRASFSGKARALHRSIDVSGLTISGVGTVEEGGGFFRRGLVLENCGNMRLEGVRMESDLHGDGVGVDIHTDQKTHACEAVLDDVTVAHFGTAIRCGGYFEGLHLTDSTVLSCSTAMAFGAEHFGRPGIYIHGNHLNFRHAGIYLQGAAQWFVIGNLFYAQYGDERTPYCAINTGASPVGYPIDGKIIGNAFVRVDELAPSSYGVVVAGGGTIENVIVDANHFTGWDIGVLLQPGSNRARVTESNAFTACRSTVLDQGSQNVVQG